MPGIVARTVRSGAIECGHANVSARDVRRVLVTRRSGEVVIPIAAAAPPAAPVDRGLEPPAPTLRLPRNFVPTGYAATLVVDPAKTGFDGSIAITGEVARARR
jgi:hypothetical protein